ncbi:MAG: nuclear transport factor 2 family protein [Calditrichaeota bacterium]|nr:nuclear transport factor 2 family protein [Calditrichota bacterium]MCB0294466.1 nuclear transport factor 2 family protein [Calditrichota bacterium]MCB0303699.1 nuclear transport factor 2 family protein [Calditrichota bacterium]
MNVQTTRNLIRSFFDHFAAENVPGILKLLAEEVEWHFPGSPDIPFAGVYQGPKRVSEFFRRMNDAVVIVEFALEDVIVQEDAAAATGMLQGRARSTEDSFSTPWAMVFNVSHGKIRKCQTFLDTAKVGLAFFEG